jgi:hypothetical protein
MGPAMIAAPCVLRRAPRWHSARLTVLDRCCRMGWRWAPDLRRPNGSCLISPRGTVFEFRLAAGRTYLQLYRDRQLID